jgi:DNA-binding transcriptional regulator YbjK
VHSVARPSSERLRTIADTAIVLLARQGMRGLTHRAVDDAAGLPPGSTSYYARTRAALLDAAVLRLAELDQADTAAELPDAGALADPQVLAATLAGMLHARLYSSRERTLARYELALEATRRPELRAVLNGAGQQFRQAAAALLAAAGSPDPERHGRVLVAWCDGVLFDTLAGAGAAHPPSFSELQAGLCELLRGMLPAG